MVNNTIPKDSGHESRSEKFLFTQKPKLFKEKSFRESLPPSTTPRPVLANKSLNSQFEPEPDGYLNLKRPSSSIAGFSSDSEALVTSNAKRAQLLPSKRPSLMNDIYLDNSETGEAVNGQVESEDDLTEDDEADENADNEAHPSEFNRKSLNNEYAAVSTTSAYRGSNNSFYPRLNWRDMTDFDYPAEVPRQLPAIEEDCVFDIGPACSSISPPSYIPKFIAQVEFCRSQIVEEIKRREREYEPSQDAISCVRDEEC